jgi:hypothetical protein
MPAQIPGCILLGVLVLGVGQVRPDRFVEGTQILVTTDVAKGWYLVIGI